MLLPCNQHVSCYMYSICVCQSLDKRGGICALAGEVMQRVFADVNVWGVAAFLKIITSMRARPPWRRTPAAALNKSTILYRLWRLVQVQPLVSLVYARAAAWFSSESPDNAGMQQYPA